ISDDCFYEFTIEVTNVTTTPTGEDVEYCIGEEADELTATLSGTGETEGYNLYYFTTETGGNTQTSLIPSTAEAGTTTYWVAEGPSAECIGERVPITVTVYEIPNAPEVINAELSACFTGTEVLDANNAIAQGDD